MPKWRADYFDTKDAKTPETSKLIEAKDASEAADKAAAQPGGWHHVDLTLTVLKTSN